MLRDYEVGLDNLIIHGNNKNCVDVYINQDHYPVGKWTQFLKSKISKCNFCWVQRSATEQPMN